MNRRSIFPVIGGMRATGRRRRTRRRWAIAALLPFGLLVTACSTATPPRHSSGTTTSTSSGHGNNGSATTTTAPPVVAANVVAERSSVPWGDVGKGWLLATWSAKPMYATGQGTGRTSASTLFLVDPQGGRYDLGSAPSGRLTDWSANGANALFVATASSGTVLATKFVVENLRTGSQQQFTTSTATGYDVQFSKPDGTAILVSGVPLHRYGLSGTLEATYPTSMSGDGAASKASGNFAETPEGTDVVLSASGGLDVVANGGAPVRFLPSQKGEDSCLLDGWWTGDDVVETCTAVLVAQPITGGAPSVIAKASATGGEYIDAWTVGNQVVAEEGACGTTWLVKVGEGGTTEKVTVPGAGSVSGVGVAGNALAVLATPNCDEPPSHAPAGNILEWYTPSSGSLRTVLGASFGGGSVDSAVVEDDR